MSDALDKTYALLGQAEQMRQQLQREHRQDLAQLESRERELLDAARDAEEAQDSTALARVEHELDELRRAIKATTEQLEDDDAAQPEDGERQPDERDGDGDDRHGRA